MKSVIIGILRKNDYFTAEVEVVLLQRMENYQCKSCNIILVYKIYKMYRYAS